MVIMTWIVHKYIEYSDTIHRKIDVRTLRERDQHTERRGRYLL